MKGYKIRYQMPGSMGIITENVYTTNINTARASIEGKGGRVMTINAIF